MIFLTAPDLRRFSVDDKEAAEKLGCSPQYLCDVLKGRRRLTAKLAIKLEEYGIPGRKRYIEQAQMDLDKASVMVSVHG